MKRICAADDCDTDITERRASAKYCSDRCRLRGFKAKTVGNGSEGLSGALPSRVSVALAGLLLYAGFITAEVVAR